MVHAAVILSGCGFADGAEIRESVLALLALDKRDVKVSIFAPDIPQAEVRDCLSGTTLPESRNVLRESARIARGHIAALSTCEPDAFDLLVIPGGFGVAKNLSDFASNGANATIEPQFARVVQGFHQQKKPIAAICIAPAVVAVALKQAGVTLTIGEDAGCAAAIEATGNRHQPSPSHQAVVDTANRIASCSAYMREDALAPIAEGIEQCIGAVVDMARQASKQAA